MPADDAETEAAIRGAGEPFVLEERMTGPECSLLALCDGAHRGGPAAGPGPQAHRRGRHRPEHRRDGRLRAGAGPVRGRRAAGDVRAAGPRPPRRRRHAVRRRALRRADADRRRAAARRVQRPLRRPRGPGRAAAAAHRPRRVAARRDERRRHAVPLESPAAPRAPSSRPPPAIRGAPARRPRSRRPDATLDAPPARQNRRVFPAGIADGRHDRWAGARRHRARSRPGRGPRRRLRRDGRRLASRACRCGATSAGGRPAPRCAPTPPPASTSTRATGPSPS